MAWKSLETLLKEAETAKKIIKLWKEDKNFDSYKSFRLRWVNSPSIISKTLWVSTRTIIRYWKRWEYELKNSKLYINRDVEVQKLLEQIDMIIAKLWNAILSDNLAWKEKVYALNQLFIPLKMKAEILWIDSKSISFTNTETTTYNFNPDIYRYFDKRITEAWIDICDLTWIRPL